MVTASVACYSRISSNLQFTTVLVTAPQCYIRLLQQHRMSRVSSTASCRNTRPTVTDQQEVYPALFSFESDDWHELYKHLPIPLRDPIDTAILVENIHINHNGLHLPFVSEEERDTYTTSTLRKLSIVRCVLAEEGANLRMLRIFPVNRLLNYFNTLSSTKKQDAALHVVDLYDNLCPAPTLRK